jgi:hypothetical protein
MSIQLTQVVMVLAAVERAELHRVAKTPGIPGWVILEHLDIGRRSMRARRVRGLLDVLQEDKLVERGRRHGVTTWTLTGAGRRCLAWARRAGEVELPESPQHRAWRSARAVAAGEIERLRRSVRVGLGEAAALLDADEPADSDAWFLLSDRLRGVLWRVGRRATACMSGRSPRTSALISTRTLAMRRSTRMRGNDCEPCTPGGATSDHCRTAERARRTEGGQQPKLAGSGAWRGDPVGPTRTRVRTRGVRGTRGIGPQLLRGDRARRVQHHPRDAPEDHSRPRHTRKQPASPSATLNMQGATSQALNVAPSRSWSSSDSAPISPDPGFDRGLQNGSRVRCRAPSLRAGAPGLVLDLVPPTSGSRGQEPNQEGRKWDKSSCSEG